MPIYEYQCQDCGQMTEVTQSHSEPPLAQCPRCSGPVRKVISKTSFRLKGSGWYATDYGQKKTKGPQESVPDKNKTDSKTAPEKTESKNKKQTKTET